MKLLPYLKQIKAPNSMENIGYKMTDWLFFFKDSQKKEFTKILRHQNNKTLIDEFITWKLITVFLPLITFLFVVFFNILSSNLGPENYYSFFNNGSLPIIAFGIITSGMPFLLEQLEGYPDLYSVRRRVMAVGLIFLFLSASIYIIQTLSIIASSLNSITNFIISIVSICVFYISSSVGYKMFILQSKNIKAYDEVVKEGVKDLTSATSDLD